MNINKQKECTIALGRREAGSEPRAAGPTNVPEQGETQARPKTQRQGREEPEIGQERPQEVHSCALDSPKRLVPFLSQIPHLRAKDRRSKKE